jgi:DNA-binding response OmpR family regulator
VLATARPPVKLVIADVVMPEMSGVNLIRQVRDRLGDIRVLYMSAYPAEILVREGIQRPTVPFLAKPFTRAELLAKVAAVLESPLDATRTTPAEGTARQPGGAAPRDGNRDGT